MEFSQEVLIILAIVLLTILLIATVAAFIYYSGIIVDIKVTTGVPPIKNFKGLYKFGRGAYKDVGPIFTEVVSIAPKSRCFGVYYDDPEQVETENLRWLVGCIVSEGDEEPDDVLVKILEQNDFKQFSFPAVNHAVMTQFPYNSQLSILIGIYRVYPRLAEFVKKNKLCAHPWIEIYDSHIIHYIAPLCKQAEFYVPETSNDSLSRSEITLETDSYSSSASQDTGLSSDASPEPARGEDSLKNGKSVTPDTKCGDSLDVVTNQPKKTVICGDATETLKDLDPIEFSTLRHRPNVRCKSESVVVSDRKQRLKDLNSQMSG